MFEEQLDKFILRIVFCCLFILVLYCYKYVHWILYPKAKKQMSQKFYPSVSLADTLHYFARIIGFGIVFSQVQIGLKNGLLFSIVDLCFQVILMFVVYLISFAVAESIAFYNFTYSDEITRRKNLCYGAIHFSLAIALALVVREIFMSAEHSLVLLLFLWAYASVAFGFAIRLYHYYSRFSFNQLVITKNMALAASYSGYILGCAFLINSVLERITLSITEYIQLTVLKWLLTVLIFPLFILGIKRVFLLQDQASIKGEYKLDVDRSELGHGLYEGVVFLTAALFTVVITEHIVFG